MKKNYLNFSWSILGKLGLLNLLVFSIVLLESLTTFIAQNKPLLQNQQLENIAAAESPHEIKAEDSDSKNRA